MSEFEYASVVVSIVLALGIADILRFLADTLREPGARRIYWVHLVWIVLLLELHLEFWWRMWSFKDQLTVSPELALVMMGPALLFMASRILLPGTGDAPDMTALYYGRKNVFFAMMILTSVWSVVTSNWSVPADQRSVLYFSLAMAVVISAVFAACIVTANRRVHAGVVLAIAALQVAEIAVWLLGAQGQAQGA